MMGDMAVTSLFSSLAHHSLTVSCLDNRIRQVWHVVQPPSGLPQPSLLLLAISLTWDVGLGLLAPSPPSSLPDTAYTAMEVTVAHLQSLITWMMENPGGLKLSSVLSQALGQFFLYHIHLWVTYIMLVVPLITPYLHHLLPLLQLLPLSLQLALAGDLLLLLTLHLHCFHAYARRLAHCQGWGLLALWRLFIGKKYNPLRDRVDSADCSVEQLFLGTVIFTILLFLFPTSLTFYCVFLGLKTVVTATSGGFRTIIALLHWMPAPEYIDKFG